MSKFIRIGQIVGAFGLKGSVKVEALTDFEDRFLPGTRLRMKGEWVTIEDMRMHKGRPLLKLSGVKDLTAAEKLQWEYLEAPAKGERDLEEDEYLVDDLVGMKVVSTNGEELGVVEDVLPYPAQDVLKVGELMIPMVKEFVKNVDVKNEIIQVELLPGMLSEEPTS
jgi:16S rRNA processing protein RimM